ncbi:MAG: hypothetical protein ACKVPX_09460 [Myxococcaceae bacterium]
MHISRLQTFRHIIGLVVLCAALPALAANKGPPPPEMLPAWDPRNDYDEYPWGVPDDRRPRRLVSGIVLLGGAGDYTSTIGEYTVIGPTWGVVISMQPLRFLGVEVGYSGARNELDLLRFPTLSRASVWRNGANAMVKLGVPYDAIRPFVGAGFGLSVTSITGSPNDGLLTSDFLGEIPLCIGIEVNGRRFNAGVRATYRLLIDAGFLPAAANGAWGGPIDVQATLGVRF